MIILVKMNLMNEIDKQNDYFYTCWPENFLSFLIILSLILLIILHSITYVTDHSAFYHLCYWSFCILSLILPIILHYITYFT